MKYSALNPKQPKKFTALGTTWVLVQPFKVVDANYGITEGPFYARSDDTTFVYMPNLEFLLGQSEEPTIMHRIQLAAGESVVWDANGKGSISRTSV